MKIGEVARRAGVRVDTVRFYEKRGLLHATRRPSGYRDLTTAAITRIVFIKRMQRIGLSLDEVGAILRDLDTHRASCVAERPHLDAASARLDAEIAALCAVRRRLKRTRARCDTGQCKITSF
jgi:DNA-binding transcriptional MerR regulator